MRRGRLLHALLRGLSGANLASPWQPEVPVEASHLAVLAFMLPHTAGTIA